MLNKIGCAVKDILGMVDLDNGTDEEKMWQCVVDRYTPSNGAEEDLKKRVNVGFIANPTGFKRFMNDPKEVELQEKLQFAYSDPVYYECLARNGYPVPFAMNDFSEENVADDQARFAIEQGVDKIKKDMSGRSDIGSDAYNDELDKRIFDWYVKTYKFYGDCKVECIDYDSIITKQGACTESSASLFYAYRYAGRKPRFMFLHDMNQSLDWIDMIPRLGEAGDHVFVGLPKSDGTYTHVDAFNNVFDARYEHAIPLTERDFAVMWLQNRRRDIDGLYRWDESEVMDNLTISMAPEDYDPYLSLLRLYTAHDREDDYKKLDSQVSRLFADVPIVGVMQDLIDPKKRDISAVLKKLSEIEKVDKNSAALAYYLVASKMAPVAMAVFDQIRKAVQDGKKVEQAVIEKAQSNLLEISKLYLRSLLLDPNFIFALRDVQRLLDDLGAININVELYSALLKEHPEHAPTMYMLAKSLLIQASLAGRGTEEALNKKSLQDARGYAGKLLETYPGNPHSYDISATINLAGGDAEAAVKELGHAQKLYRKNRISGNIMPKDSYLRFLGAYLEVRDIDGFEALLEDIIKDHPDKGAAMIVSHLKEEVEWTIGWPSGNIQDDNIRFGKDEEAAESICQFVETACDKLADNSEVRQDIAAVRAYFLPFAAFIQGSEASDWLDATGDKNSAAVQLGFSKGLKQMANVLLSANGAADKDRYDNLREIFDEMEEYLNDGVRRNQLLPARVGLLKAYILLEEKETAEELFAQVMRSGTDSPQILLMYGNGIVKDIYQRGNGTKTNTARLILALDLVWKEREHFAPAVMAKFGQFYEAAAELCDKNGLGGEAEKARERVKEINGMRK